ncbi:hypothetical protein HMPREF2832_01205 [Streptococcus sp. HMSC073D05]|uniref:Uncharacterized protein n=1 Tax=Streptococcus parasanguinis (strain ATCC 15912 / DSM 6778 / CIP 104372 / LMG 14537) TaxID=760570 RepID=F8DEX3_STREP|nr:hypothetical protein HMPREF0833_10015 [Streptococcus parasanguinis ATCC 15912]OFK08142.1 hypothetical protein HMPREF2832_01205 [Streptococcus sp. HMSC073D05]
MCQNWLLMDKNEIIMSFCFKDERCGLCPKLGGTADQHIRPCQINDRDDFSFTPLAKGGCHETIF